MKHYGDITKIDGHKVPIVDIVTGGSPCQDLSVAGKRAGLDGERSGLFMEQVRIFKEMRNEHIKQLHMRGADVNLRLVRPRFFVWENVPGAFSSNKGEDFRCVLEEVCRIADKDATVPMPEKGKWNTSGCIMGDGYSVAWRVHDAQFWGVPQRRKRISLVADFGGQTAPEILFERKSVSGDIEESAEQREETPRNAGTSIAETISFQERAGCEGGARESSFSITEQEPCQHSTTNQCLSIDEKMGQTYVGDDIGNTLGARDYKQPQAVVYGISSYDSNAMKSANPHSGIYEADTSRTLDLNGGSPACNQGGMMVVEGFDGYNTTPTGEVSKTITSGRNDTRNIPVVLEGNGQRDSHKGDGYKVSETMYTLNTVEQHAVCTYQKTTGALTPGAHAGSYNGQDAYNDMLIVGGVQNENQSQQVKHHFF